LLLAGLLAWLLAPARLAAQAPVQAPKPAPKPPASGAAAVPAPPDTFTYRAEGRRDPFVSLLNRGTDTRQNQRRQEGVAGMSAGDIVLKGIMQSRGVYLAIIQGPDVKRHYIVRPNDRFADGVVKAITADSMLILQEVNDPLSLTKQREIRKTLRAVEEVK
jgi:Tfp pilus assembly protein PilP